MPADDETSWWKQVKDVILPPIQGSGVTQEQPSPSEAAKAIQHWGSISRRSSRIQLYLTLIILALTASNVWLVWQTTSS